MQEENSLLLLITNTVNIHRHEPLFTTKISIIVHTLFSLNRMNLPQLTAYGFVRKDVDDVK